MWVVRRIKGGLLRMYGTYVAAFYVCAYAYCGVENNKSYNFFMVDTCFMGSRLSLYSHDDDH